jgi:hypothetical protein
VRAWVGRSILVIAVIHTVFGAVAFRGVAAPVLREGVFNSVRIQDTSERTVAFWFFISGLLLFIVGGLVDQSERLRIRLPAFLQWGLLALAAIGSVLMPASAFWLLFVPAAGVFIKRRERPSGEKRVRVME